MSRLPYRPDEVRGPVPRPLADRLSAALALPAAQQPRWPDPERASAVVEQLHQAPPIVTAAETTQLAGRLAQVARGEAFLLQGGDCAETFAGNTAAHVRANLRVLAGMAAVLADAAELPVVKVARMAGQYAKPRSRAVDGRGLPAYRGDIVNSAYPSVTARTPDPDRMPRAHDHAVATMELVRELSAAGALDPCVPRRAPAPAALDTDHPAALAEEVHVSHELLLLDYERAGLWVDTSGPEPRLASRLTHFPWIGYRTRHLDGAHVAFAALLANPVGLKIGPDVTPEEAVEYVRRLDPHGIPGKVTLVSRMGRDRVREALPPIVEKVATCGHHVVWSCDPMHGNTRTSRNGYKTRHLAEVVDEVAGFFEVHRRLGTHPGGLHVEVTGDDVAECLGVGTTEADLPHRYETVCDPRLNAEQSIEFASRVADLLRRQRARFGRSR